MADYKSITLLSLNKWENEKKPGTGFELRVVHMILDGKSKGVGVEKVYFYANGEKTIGKSLQGKDLNTIWTHKVEIKALMDNPPPIPAAPEPAPLDDGSTLGGGTLETAPFS